MRDQNTTRHSCNSKLAAAALHSPQPPCPPAPAAAFHGHVEKVLLDGTTALITFESGASARSALLFDGAHSSPLHWSSKLSCKDLERQLSDRLLRDLTHFKGRLVRYEVWKGALHWREWIERCGESLFFDAYRWAQQADATAALLTSEPAVLDSLTLTKAEAYHNMIWAMATRGVPVGAVGVQALRRRDIGRYRET